MTEVSDIIPCKRQMSIELTRGLTELMEKIRKLNSEQDRRHYISCIRALENNNFDTHIYGELKSKLEENYKKRGENV